MTTPNTSRNISTGAKIIARASASILRDTRPQYTREDKHALELLREYWI